MRAVEAERAWKTAIGAGAVLAGEAGDAIVRVVAGAVGSKASSDALLTGVGWIGAIDVFEAGPRPCDEAARQVHADHLVAFLAAGLQTDLAHRTGVELVAERVTSGTCRAQGARFAPRSGRSTTPSAPAAARGAAFAAPALATRPAAARVRIDGGVSSRVDGERGGGRFSTAGHDHNGQRNVSKGAHQKGRGRGASRMGA